MFRRSGAPLCLMLYYGTEQKTRGFSALLRVPKSRQEPKQKPAVTQRRAQAQAITSANFLENKIVRTAPSQQDSVLPGAPDYAELRSHPLARFLYLMLCVRRRRVANWEPHKPDAGHERAAGRDERWHASLRPGR
jgi:hypothetical protein